MKVPRQNNNKLIPAVDYIQCKNEIIIIRQYYSNFKDKLNTIFGTTEKEQKKFINSLTKTTLQDLKNIHELIIFELTLKRNHNTFETGSKTILNAIELFCTRFLKIDVSGSTEQLFNDENFKQDLLMVSCEMNISNYLTPRRSLFLRTLQNYYMNYRQNKEKKNIQNIEKNMKDIKIDNEIK